MEGNRKGFNEINELLGQSLGAVGFERLSITRCGGGWKTGDIGRIDGVVASLDGDLEDFDGIKGEVPDALPSRLGYRGFRIWYRIGLHERCSDASGGGISWPWGQNWEMLETSISRSDQDFHGKHVFATREDQPKDMKGPLSTTYWVCFLEIEINRGSGNYGLGNYGLGNYGGLSNYWLILRSSINGNRDRSGGFGRWEQQGKGHFGVKDEDHSVSTSFRNIGEAIVVVREVDLDGDRVQMTVDAFQPLIFDTVVEFQGSVETLVLFRERSSEVRYRDDKHEGGATSYKGALRGQGDSSNHHQEAQKVVGATEKGKRKVAGRDSHSYAYPDDKKRAPRAAERPVPTREGRYRNGGSSRTVTRGQGDKTVTNQTNSVNMGMDQTGKVVSQSSPLSPAQQSAKKVRKGLDFDKVIPEMDDFEELIDRVTMEDLVEQNLRDGEANGSTGFEVFESFSDLLEPHHDVVAEEKISMDQEELDTEANGTMTKLDGIP
ncbi:unnamed protein product [Thlaspi arvense]|uniref:Uncharacterized protein n=1 Tax=Thlaspi arvense TaxID=13288 RepID=A0AAU9SG72_THLAR|nr:unnamed protein product [Thlaspi arvense]